MQAPLTHQPNSSARGFSVFELLIVVAMVSVIAGFVLLNLFQGRQSVARTATASELANHLHKARLDSMRRNAKEMSQMAQVKIFNRRFYSVAIDADGDSQLDVPLVMALPEEKGVEIQGPFPKTFIFDWLGQPVDAQNHHTNPQPITIVNSAGASSIKFTETGKVIVVPSNVKVASK